MKKQKPLKGNHIPQKTPTPPSATSHKQAETSGANWADTAYRLLTHSPLVSLMSFSILIGLFACWKYFTQRYSFFFMDIGSDTLNILFTEKISAFRALQETAVPKWNFDHGMGQSVFAGIATHPATYLDRLMGAIWGEKSIIQGWFHFYFVSSVLGGGLIAYWYFRLMKLDKLVAIMASMAIAFVGYAVLASSWGHGLVYANGIFYLIAFEELYQRKRPYFIPLAVVFIAWNPFYLYLYTAFLLLYSIARVVGDGKSMLYWLRTFVVFGLWGLIGFAMSVANNVGVYEVMMNSPRMAGSVVTFAKTANNAAIGIDNYSEHVTALMRLFSNDMLGSGNNFKGWYNYLEAPALYAGLLSLVLLPQLFVFLRGKALWAHGSIIAYLSAIVIFPPFRHALLFFLGDYYKGVINFQITFGIVFYGFWALNFILSQKRITLWVLLGSIGVYFIALMYPYAANPGFPSANNPVDGSIRNIVLLYLAAYGLLIYFLHKQPKYLIISLLVVFGIELTSSTYISMNQRKPFRMAQFKRELGGFYDGSERAAKELKATDKSFYRVEKDYFSGKAMHGSLNDAQVQGYYGTASYASFNQLYYIHFLEKVGIARAGDEGSTRWAQGLYSRPLLQTVGNVKYFMSKEANPVAVQNGYGAVIGSYGDVKLLRNTYAIPFGYTYTHIMPESAFDSLPILEKDKALLRACIVADQDLDQYKQLPRYFPTDSADGYSMEKYRADTDSLRADSLAITSWDNNHFDGTLNLKQPKILMLTIPFTKGWHLVLDGKETPLQVLNIGFSGILVPAGQHDVKLNFQPLYLDQTFWVSVGAAILYFLLLVFYGIRYFTKRRTAHNLPQDTSPDITIAS